MVKKRLVKRRTLPRITLRLMFVSLSLVRINKLSITHCFEGCNIMYQGNLPAHVTNPLKKPFGIET